MALLNYFVFYLVILMLICSLTFYFLKLFQDYSYGIIFLYLYMINVDFEQRPISKLMSKFGYP